MSRRSSFGSLLSDIFKQESEFYSGRLNIFPNFWRWAINVPAEIQQQLDSGKKRVIVRDETDSNRVTDWFEIRDGRVAEMVTGQCVICPNVDLWPDAFPHKGKGDEVYGRWVKMSACRKCEHYRSTKQTGLRYASCYWAKLTRSGKKTARQAATESVAGTVATAVKQAEEWVK